MMVMQNILNYGDILNVGNDFGSRSLEDYLLPLRKILTIPRKIFFYKGIIHIILTNQNGHNWFIMTGGQKFSPRDVRESGGDCKKGESKKECRRRLRTERKKERRRQRKRTKAARKGKFTRKVKKVDKPEKKKKKPHKNQEKPGQSQETAVGIARNGRWGIFNLSLCICF